MKRPKHNSQRREKQGPERGPQRGRGKGSRLDPQPRASTAFPPALILPLLSSPPPLATPGTLARPQWVTCVCGGQGALCEYAWRGPIPLAESRVSLSLARRSCQSPG